MTETWIILGATSAMARAFIRDRAGLGAALILCGRDIAEMEAGAADALARGAAGAEVMAFDIRRPESFGSILERAAHLAGLINVAVFVGSMPQQSEVDDNPALIAGTVTDNLTGPATFLHRIAPMLEARGSGFVVGVSSVSGDRGRLSNYVYGASKSGFSAYLSGYRNRMARSGVHVMTVKPGPVDTAMTFGQPKLPFMSSPEAVAADIARGLRKRRRVIYTGPIWRVIMTVIRLIPEPIFMRTKF